MTTHREQLVAALRDLEVEGSPLLMVHASMRKVGPIEGGADGLLDALIGVLGSERSLVMLLCADDDEPFDCHRTPADPDIGVLAERLRQRPGVKVNDHPAARFAVLGPHADELLRDTPLHHYYGPGSLLERFAERGGNVLRLGANIDTVTLTHWAEYRADIPHKREARRKYELATGDEIWIESLDDTYGIVDGSVGEYFHEILVDYLAEGHAHVGPVGNCTAELLHGAHFVDYAVAWMEARLTQ